YVVVSADPWDAYATEFPDGTYLHGATSLSQITVSRARTLDRVRDLQVVMDHLQIWNVADPLLAGRLDLEHVATMGMSWGGGIAAEAARLDSRVDIAVALDPGFIEVDELLRVGMSKPCLTVCNPSNTDLRLYDKLRKDAFWFQLRSTVHNDFWDYYWLAGSGRLASQREATATVNRFVLWFLNTHLKGMHEPMPALADYPRVINFKQK
ncbi:MAG: hypothetical protein L6Q38_15140, partial [Nitrospira sp.]|nr:hypothetical protein [Nitrospira sp.]